MAVREDKLGQSWLFPLCIGDFVPRDHICNLVVAVVSCIDVREIEAKYRDQPGNPAYPRRMLLRLLVQAAVDGVWSSRKIDKLAHENVIYMYLAGNEKPDFRTLCNFRRDKKELIEAVFKETVTVARDLRILKLGYLATDGTKTKANASKDHTLSEDEDKLYGDKRGDELQKERIELSYNPQITLDHDSGIIVANDVTQDCTDHHQLQPQVEKTEETVGELPDDTKLGFDNGYFSGANCGKCPFRAECAGEGKKRTITSDGYEGERRRMAAKMRSDTGKAEYKKRSETLEWIFGNIKQNMKFREFLTRGLENVRMEYNLVCSAHNLKIIWGKLSRDAAVIGKIFGVVANLASKVKNFLVFHPVINLKCQS